MFAQAFIKFKTIVLYHEDDILYESEIMNHLKHYLDISKIQFSSLEFDQVTLENVSPIYVNNLCSIIILVSKSLPRTSILIKKAYKEISIQNAYQNIIAIPIFIDNITLIGSPFQKITYLRSNNNALSKLPLHDYHKNLKSISTEIKALANKKIKLLEAIKQYWKEAEDENSIQAYTSFLKKFPNSTYATLAKTKRESLRESKLWKNAISLDQIHHYLKYIIDSDKKEHIKKATIKIYNIEQDENSAEKDVKNNDNLSLLLRYKLKYRNSSEINAINTKIFQILANPVNISEKRRVIITESNLLELKICQNCSSIEIFEYFMLKDSFEKIYHKLETLNKKMKSSKKELTALILFGIIITALIIMLNILPSLLFFILFSIFIAGLFIILKRIYNINTILKYAFTELKKKTLILTELKLTFITKDVLRRNSLFLQVFNLEEWIEGTNYRKHFNYFSENEVTKINEGEKIANSLNYSDQIKSHQQSAKRT